MTQLFKNPLTGVLVFGIMLLYMIFLSLDISSMDPLIQSRYLKYGSMILCLILVILLTFKSTNKSDSGYVLFALVLTVIADYFLLFTTHHLIGIFFFCLVQLVYLKRYHQRFFKVGLGCGVVSAAVYFLLPLEPLYVIAGLYSMLILMCFGATFIAKMLRFNLYCVRLGMALFVLCDIHVALFNELPRSAPYYPFVTIAMWLFYLPAQLLLALSACHFKDTCGNLDRKMFL